jgi:hypothetical protein
MSAFNIFNIYRLPISESQTKNQKFYTRIHDSIIQNRRSNPLPKDEYGEWHHIVPRSFGGSDNTDNLVRLSAREHFIVHYLLTRFLDHGSLNWAKMSVALKRMTHPRSQINQNVKIKTSKAYETARKDAKIANMILANNRTEEEWKEIVERRNLTIKSFGDEYKKKRYMKSANTRRDKSAEEERRIQEKRKKAFEGKSAEEKENSRLKRRRAMLNRSEDAEYERVLKIKESKANFSKEKIEDIVNRTNKTKSMWDEEKIHSVSEKISASHRMRSKEKEAARIDKIIKTRSNRTDEEKEVTRLKRSSSMRAAHAKMTEERKIERSLKMKEAHIGRPREKEDERISKIKNTRSKRTR